MNDQVTPVATRAIMTFDDMDRLAVAAASSGLFGFTKKEQALCLFAICQAEGLNPILALKRYHIIEGKPSMRADAMQGEFLAHGGGIMWHVRSDSMCAATFFTDKNKINDASRDRAIKRFDLLWRMESEEDTALSRLMVELAKLSMDGEETILRTIEDADEKGLTTSWKKNEKTNQYEKKTKTNWQQSPRQMLTARVITEGVRLINPGLIAGIYSPDEIQDIVSNELRDREEFVARALTAPNERDRAAIRDMIKQHLDDASNATNPEEKRRLLGLASELRCELDNLDAPPAEKRITVREELPSTSEPELVLSGEAEPTDIPWQNYVLQHVKSKVLIGRKLGDFSKAEIKTVHGKTQAGLLSSDPKIATEAAYIHQAYVSFYGADEEEAAP